MALQKEIMFDNGVEIPNAYIKVTRIVFEYFIPNTAIIEASIWRNLSTYTEGRPEIEKMEYVCTGTDYETYFDNDKFVDKDPRQLAYEYLLTMEFYSEALSI
jgi:hypothetical protein